MSVVRQRKKVINNVNIFYSIPSSLFYSKIIQEPTFYGISALSWHRILFLNDVIRAKAMLVAPHGLRICLLQPLHPNMRYYGADHGPGDRKTR